jgi:hypothetical protein
MIRLYSRSGSKEVNVLDKVIQDQVWTIEKRNIVKLLKSRGHKLAANILDSTLFELRNGINGFKDKFYILYYHVPCDKYVTISNEYEEKKEVKLAYQYIAEAVTEEGYPIRFIVLELEADSNVEVIPAVNLSLEISSDSVKRALADAEHLIQARGASSGVDRLHTAFHGYLKAIALKAKIPFPESCNVISLFKLLKEKHPAFIVRGARATDIDRVLKSMSAIVDALNSIRNLASGAHPNELVLKEPEAMLMINSVSTLLSYIDAKLCEITG